MGKKRSLKRGRETRTQANRVVNHQSSPFGFHPRQNIVSGWTSFPFVPCCSIMCNFPFWERGFGCVLQTLFARNKLEYHIIHALELSNPSRYTTQTLLASYGTIHALLLLQSILNKNFNLLIDPSERMGGKSMRRPTTMVGKAREADCVAELRDKMSRTIMIDKDAGDILFGLPTTRSRWSTAITIIWQSSMRSQPSGDSEHNEKQTALSSAAGKHCFDINYRLYT